ncbi:MAG TPA: integrase domain-containing protein [Candidatus Competibacter sp.]|nr:integrase domain-containing protein [Candidatus Competibacter sp.]
MKRFKKEKAIAQKTPRSRAAVASIVEADETKPRLGKRGQALASLDGVLKKNLRRSANGRKAVSHATIADRAGFYDRMIRQLHELGYKITEVRHLKPKHIEALMRLWETQGLSASTLQKRFSQLRLLCGWIGKQSMLRDGPSYLANPEAFQRTYEAQYDHSWTAAGVDPVLKIAEIAAADPQVARVLRLQHAFGLRLQEASLLNPLRDRVDEIYLRVWAGTKGGRPRVVPIETDAQRAVLAEAEGYVALTKRSMIPPESDLKQWLQHCYYVLAQHGITRQDGLVSHGLRHQYANDVYEQRTGETSPVRGGCGGQV